MLGWDLLLSYVAPLESGLLRVTPDGWEPLGCRIDFGHKELLLVKLVGSLCPVPGVGYILESIGGTAIILLSGNVLSSFGCDA